MANERGRRTEEERRPAGNQQPGQRSRRVDEEDIRNRAYNLYERRGGEHGHDWDDWLEAERQLQSDEKADH